MLRLILPASVTDSVTAVSTAAVTRSEPANTSAARSLAVLADFLTNSRAASGTSRFWMFLNASLKPAKAVLVSVVIGVSPSSLVELWAHPVRFGPGHGLYAIVNCAMQYPYCSAISRNREIALMGGNLAPP